MVPYLSHATSPCMRKLDGLPWVDGFVVAPFGTRLGVRVNDAKVLPELVELVPPEWRTLSRENRDVAKNGAALFDDDDEGQGVPCDLMISVKYGGGEARRGSKNFNLVYVGIQRLTRTLDWAEALVDVRARIIESIAFSTQSHAIVPGTLLRFRGTGLLFLGPDVPESWITPFLDLGAEVITRGQVALGEGGDACSFLSEKQTASYPPLPVSCAFSVRSISSRKQTRIATASVGVAAMTLFGFTLSADVSPSHILPLVSKWTQKVPLGLVDLSEQNAPGPQLLRYYEKNLNNSSLLVQGARA